ncbi:endogenous retrovirus group K member 113 Gag polyprotein-like [Pseudopipra pipra]|uniref:endogenous retrovirus group K member 113 Gag polyprotein-like n=1 Tax=Pseudopipra pipra TaxID=415032 RepID=UPI0031399DDB
MGQHITKEESVVLSTWKSLLSRKNVKVTDFALRRILLWCRKQGFEATSSTAFSISAWEKVGDKLWDEISKGSKDANDLAVTWRWLFDTLKEWQAEQQTGENETKSASTQNALNSKEGSSTDTKKEKEQSETLKNSGGDSAGSNPGQLQASQCSDGGLINSETDTKPSRKYPTPNEQLAASKHESKPSRKYITPEEQLKMPQYWTSPTNITPSSYRTPAQQLAEFEAQDDPLHTALPSSDEDEEAVVSHPVTDNTERAACQPCVTDRKKGAVSRPLRKTAEPWTLPPVTVTVMPRHPGKFWNQVKQKAAEMGDWNLLDRIGYPSETCDAAASTGPGAYPVFKAVPGSGRQDEHTPFAWKVVQDLQMCASKYGINSAEVMRLIRVINTDQLAPYDISHLGQILFQPIQYQVFLANWRKLAERAALDNMQLPQGDPRRGAGVDALMGTGPVFSNPQVQAQWPPAVLEQCQRMGMSALIQTMELAAPKPKYTTVKQGVKEPFLQFVERIATSLEKQVDDEDLRQRLCLELAKDNANEDCQRIIEAMPGTPSIPEMVAACSKVGSVAHKMTALAAVLRPNPKCYGCGKQGHVKAECPVQQRGNKQKNKAAEAEVTCGRCGKAGHFSKACRSKYHVNGQLLQGNWKKSAMRRVRIQVPHPPNSHTRTAPMAYPSVTASPEKPVEQQEWMYPQPTQ